MLGDPVPEILSSDLNDDGYRDIYVAGYGQYEYAELGTASPTVFTAVVSPPGVAAYPRPAVDAGAVTVLSEFDHDGVADSLVGPNIQFGGRDETQSIPAPTNFYGNPSTAKALDFNGDGVADLAVTYPSGTSKRSVAFYLGVGATPPTDVPEVPTGILLPLSGISLMAGASMLRRRGQLARKRA